MSKIPEVIQNAAVTLKANVYFDGGVVSHTLVTGSGARQTVGFIRPGEYHFNTQAPEQMDIVAGQCRVKLAGEKEWKNYAVGQTFRVAGNSSFDIVVEKGFAEYLCSFLN